MKNTNSTAMTLDEVLNLDDVNSKSKFSNLGITDEINKALEKRKFTTPTQIQEQAIPVALKGKDIIGIAQTGTGKTLAFALPVVQKLLSNTEQALIIVPTRELAYQVEEAIRNFVDCLPSRLSSVILVGGIPIRRQLEKLKRKPRLVIATPGRLRDHLNRKSFNLKNCKTVVLDEADRMFDIGFAPEIKYILSLLPLDRQILLFSATMPRQVRELINDNLRNPEEVEVTKQGTSVDMITQELCILEVAEKVKILQKILKNTSGSTIVFSKTKIGTAKLANKIYKMGFESVELHSDRSMRQRKRAIDGFRTGKFQVLVATDIAARGIDISDVELVINYDLPQAAEDYVHRIGRTGRAGKAGRAITFASTKQFREIRKIENVTSFKFELNDLSLPFSKFDKSAPVSKKGRSRRRNGARGRGRTTGGGSGRKSKRRFGGNKASSRGKNSSSCGMSKGRSGSARGRR